MALHRASKQMLCYRSVIRRHQSTFSFFSRNKISSPSPVVEATTRSTSSPPSQSTQQHLLSSPHALKISPSYSNAAPLLAAIQNKDQDTAWMVYSALGRAGLLNTLLPLHHSILLKSIRPLMSHRYTRAESRVLVERFEQVWDGMLQCHIQPDITDHTARLELFSATRHYNKFDQAWAELLERANQSGSNRVGGAPLQFSVTGLQPTLYTYNLVLASCVPRKNIALAMETMTLMRRAGIKPDNMSWDYVLQIHTAMRNWPAVESTFQSAFVTLPIESNGPRKQNHATLSVPLGQRARTLHGGSLVNNNNSSSNSSNNNNNSSSNSQLADQQKLVPSVQNIQSLFSYIAYTQDMEELRTLFKSHMRLFGVMPSTRAYNEMIKTAFLARRDDEAHDLFRELVQIGRNVEKLQEGGEEAATELALESASESDSASSGLSSPQGTTSGAVATSTTKSLETTGTQQPIVGPDFNTFKILINNEFMASRNRWGRAWKWMQIMQKGYGLDPSDAMFRRTLSSMERRGADEATIAAVRENWENIIARRNGFVAASSRSPLESRRLNDDQLESEKDQPMLEDRR
ncbi:hypothetical protein BGZ94_009152 [Podila epigama]|nr:hypothetical protein BGZ94_009152 [Podila epigama]